jgi:hypothetical protein
VRRSDTRGEIEMAQIYKAILHGDRVEWIDPPPKRKEPIQINITLEENARPRHNNCGDEMARVLEALARGGGLSAIPNPSDWQREVRQDRPMPEREKRC